jgi:phospholipase C
MTGSTHKFLTRQGFAILGNSDSIWGTKWVNQYGPGRVQHIIENSVSPDSLETDPTIFGISTYAGHFFDPDTGNNYLGGSDITALTRFKDHYYAAQNLIHDGIRTWDDEFANAVHYFQDATCPFHAANNANFINGFDHSEFEGYAENYHDLVRIDRFDSPVDDRLITIFEDADIDVLLRNCAKMAKYIYLLYHIGEDHRMWEPALRESLIYSQKFTAGLLYKFALENRF